MEILHRSQSCSLLWLCFPFFHSLFFFFFLELIIALSFVWLFFYECISNLPLNSSTKGLSFLSSCRHIRYSLSFYLFSLRQLSWSTPLPNLSSCSSLAQFLSKSFILIMGIICLSSYIPYFLKPGVFLFPYMLLLFVRLHTPVASGERVHAK